MERFCLIVVFSGIFLGFAAAEEAKQSANYSIAGLPMLKNKHLNIRPGHVVYTMSSTEEGKLLAILQPYVTMLEAVLEQYFKSDADAAVLFRLLGTLGRHVIVKGDVAEVRPALVKESVSFMREYNKFARWLSDHYNDASLLPVADIMNRVFASRFGKRMKIIETEMKRLGQQDAWDELMKVWNTVNASDTEKLFAMSTEELRSLDKFLDKTKTLAMEHKSFELLYQTQVVESLADLARSMTARIQPSLGASPATKFRRNHLQPQLAGLFGQADVTTTDAGIMTTKTVDLSACTCSKSPEDRDAREAVDEAEANSTTSTSTASPKPKRKRHDQQSSKSTQKKEQNTKKKRSENSSASEESDKGKNKSKSKKDENNKSKKEEKNRGKA
ncbi:unnamed protein product [Notodromas monacha]|uniref:Uncharacterized protein n=1 Tax=Notodromas monacha TaxID=399045 RepID=A0A7R9BNZ9_9CRUS|nr:unnamed protein product [Notodromas monacha]CAG0919034.1 unnamed protein product [Notodromas monacha]